MKINPEKVEKDVQGYCPNDSECPGGCRYDCYDPNIKACTSRVTPMF